jgi:hypothetical protein
MPYSITTRDGIKITNIPDDVPPDAQELKDRVAAIRAGQTEAPAPAPVEAPPAPAAPMGYDALLSPIEAIRAMGSTAPAPAPAEVPMGYNIFSSPAVGAEVLAGVPGVGEWTDEMANRISPGLGERLREEREALRTSAPGLSIAANLAGVLLSSIPAVRAVRAVGTAVPAVARGVEATRRFLSAGQGVGRPAQAVRATGVGAVGGAAEGAVSGAGAAEEGERFGGAMRGLLLGGTFGGAAGLGATGMQALASRLRGGDAQAAQKILSEQAGFEVSPQAAKIVQDQVMRGDLDGAARTLQQLGNEATLAAAAPTTALGLGAAMRRSPEAAAVGREALTDVTGRQLTATEQRLNDVLGPPADLEDIKRARAKETEVERGELYDTAFSSPIDYSTPEGKRLRVLLRRVRRNYGQALEFSETMMRGEPTTTPRQQVEVRRDSAGNIISRISRPTVQGWDFIARGLEDISGTQTTSRAQNAATASRNLAKEIRDTLKETVPGYRVAVEAGQKNIERRKALVFGNDLLEDATTRGYAAAETLRLRGILDDTTDIEAGLRSRLDEIVANARSSVARPDTAVNALTRVDGILSSDAARAKLVTAIGKDKADQIFEELANVRATLDLRRAANVSERQAAEAAMTQGIETAIAPGPTLRALTEQGIPAAGVTIARALTGRTREAQDIADNKLAVEITRVLTQMKGQNARDALALMRRYETTGKPLNETQARMVAKVVTLPSALAFYSQRAPIAESTTEAMLSLGKPSELSLYSPELEEFERQQQENQ